MSAKNKSKKGTAPSAETAVTNKENIIPLNKEEADPKKKVPLNDTEKQLFESSEKTIESGLSSFIEVGKALKAIKSQELYREQYDLGYGAYCEQRWGMSRQQAERLIGASNCWLKLEKELPKGTYLPINEAQLRSLVPLGEDKWVETWQQVLTETKGEKITAKKVKDIVSGAPIGDNPDPGDEPGDEPDADETDTESLDRKSVV